MAYARNILELAFLLAASTPAFYISIYISDLLLLHKSRNGLVSTDVNNFLSIFVPRYQTRTFDPNNYNLIFKHKL